MNNNNNNVLSNQNIISTVKDTQLKGALESISKFQALIKSQFVSDHHYGIIPGTGKKPTLFKPGAEVIITLLGLSTNFEIVNCTRNFDTEFFDYIIKCTLKKDGYIIAEGLGSANTKEKKFARKEGEGAGQDNNVLKMAKKRAIVDAALQVGSLSDVFTQDFDDEDLKDLKGNKAENNSFENAQEQPITKEQAKLLFGISKGKATTYDATLVKEVISKYGYKTSDEVKKKDFDVIKKEIEEAAKKRDENI